jgi:hypothetical protein
MMDEMHELTDLREDEYTLHGVKGIWRDEKKQESA